MNAKGIRFQPRISASELDKSYGKEAQCEAALARAHVPSVLVCSACGSAQACAYHMAAGPGWQCQAGHRQTSFTAGTIFHSGKVALTVWFHGMYALAERKNNVALALELQRLLGARYPTAWCIKHKLMQAMAERRLDGGIEVVDDHLGGEHSSGRRGHGSENKVPFISAASTRDGRPRCVRFDPVASFTNHAVADWAKRALAQNAQTASDGPQAFSTPADRSSHEHVVMGGGPQSLSLPAFRWVNTLLGNLKTALLDTYHAFGFRKYGQRYRPSICTGSIIGRI